MEGRVSMKSGRINIFGHLNHLGNQYDMLKLAKKYPVKFHYLENNVRKWSHLSPRPEPTTWLTSDEFEWVQHYEPGKYDVAILHVDQQHVNPHIGKGFIYKQLNELIQDIPKIVINHGTPMYAEMYDEDIVINGGEVLTSNGTRRVFGMKELIGDNFMLVNSYEAVERWGWGYPIIHGLTASEWWDLPKEPRVVISLSPGGLDKYYNRQLLTHIKAHVKDKTNLDVQHIMVNYKCHDWDDYRDFIGRSLIYINPTLDSPMPRSRTEAMLSGCLVLTSPYHGASDFIEHGKDGFIMPDNPVSYAETIAQLINHNYKQAVQMGQRGKEKAQRLFNNDRYLDDLFYILTEIVDGRRPEWKGEKLW